MARVVFEPGPFDALELQLKVGAVPARGRDGARRQRARSAVRATASVGREPEAGPGRGGETRRPHPVNPRQGSVVMGLQSRMARTSAQQKVARDQ